MREGYQEIRDQPCSQTLSNVQDHQEKLFIIGYKSNQIKQLCFYIISCIFCGIPLLVCHWYKHFSVIKYSKSSLKEADYVLVKVSNQSGKEICKPPKMFCIFFFFFFRIHMTFISSGQ